ncbi:serine/threonine protein kinase [Actinobaculum sp. 352]|nr:serine/threonine protein kinase [Actinobaculum sp. 352]
MRSSPQLSMGTSTAKKGSVGDVRERAEIGGYRLIRRIGYGGMSTVFEAEDGSGQRVALKLLHPAVVADEAGRTRLRREVQTMQRVRGPYVAEVLDAETEEDEAFIVTELIEGPTLEQDVQDSGVYKGGDLASLAADLATAIRSVHGAEVLHRDLKPSNVMVSDHGPVLIDFGIAQLEEDSRLTVPGSLTHTPGYCDARVISGAAPDEAADWWALTAVLAYAATGHDPYGSGNSPAVMRRVLTGEPDLTGLDSRLVPAFERALATEAEQRISFDTLVDALRDPSQTERLLEEADAARGGDSAPSTGQVAGILAAENGADAPGATRVLPSNTAASTAVLDSSGAFAPNVHSGSDARSNSDGQATQLLPPVGKDSQSGEGTGVANSSGAGAVAEDGLTARYELGAGFPAVDTTEAMVNAPTQTLASPPTAAYMSPQVYSSPPTAAYNTYTPDGYAPVQESYPPRDVPAVAQPGDPAYGYEAPYEVPDWLCPAPSAKLLVALLGMSCALLAVVWPLAVLSAFGMLSILASAIGLSYHDLRERRMRAGRRRATDHTWTVMRVPWTLARSFFLQLVSITVGAFFGIATLWIVGLLTGDQRLSLLVGVAVFLLGAWLIASSEHAREGTRRVIAAVAPTAGYRTFWIVVLLAAALGSGVIAYTTHVIDWAPLADVPFLFSSIPWGGG